MLLQIPDTTCEIPKKNLSAPPPSSRNMWTGMWIITGKNQSLILLASLTILNGLCIEKKTVQAIY